MLPYARVEGPKHSVKRPLAGAKADVRFWPISDVANRPEAMGWTPPHLNGIEVPDWECHQPVAREKGLP